MHQIEAKTAKKVVTFLSRKYEEVMETDVEMMDKRNKFSWYPLFSFAHARKVTENDNKVTEKITLRHR